MEKKTCILIMPALFSGGAEKQYRYIMNEVSGSKNRVIVLLLNSPAESEKEITEKFIEKHPNIEFYQLDGRVMSTEKKGLTIKYEKLKCFFKQKKWIRKFLRENKVDIVMFSYVTQLLLVPIFKRYGIKTVFNERNTGRQICDKKFKKALLKKCDRVVANSKYAAQYVKNATGIDVAVINNGIEDKKLEKKEHSGFNVLIPARITRVKNQMVAVRALQYLNDIPVKIYLAGGVEDQGYFDELRTESEKLQILDKIEFCGYVKNMQQLYAMTDLVVLPSYEEGTPNVLLEAYLYGIPAVASNIPMNRDCVVNSEMLFEPDNAQALSERIRYVARKMKTEDIEDICEENLSFVKENYSMGALKKRYNTLLFS